MFPFRESQIISDSFLVMQCVVPHVVVRDGLRLCKAKEEGKTPSPFLYLLNLIRTAANKNTQHNETVHLKDYYYSNLVNEEF